MRDHMRAARPWRSSGRSPLGGTATAQSPPPPSARLARRSVRSATPTGLLGCHSKDEAKPDPVKFVPCLDKALKFDGGVDPTKGCFEKLEAKPPCLTTGDSGSIDSRGNAFVIDAVTTRSIPRIRPRPSASARSGKNKCVTNLVKALLGCDGKNTTKPDPVKLGSLSRQGEDQVHRRRRSDEGLLREARVQDAQRLPDLR